MIGNNRRTLQSLATLFLAFGAVLLLLAACQSGDQGSGWQTPTETLLSPTPRPIGETAVPVDTPVPTVSADTPEPTLPSREDYWLTWRREPSVWGRCDYLMIDGNGRAYYGLCDAAAGEEQLAGEALDRFYTFVGAHASFRERQLWGGEVVQVALEGLGHEPPTEDEKTELLSWVEAIFDALMESDRRDALATRAQMHLAQRLGIERENVRILLVDPAVWRDSCLGLTGYELNCLSVPTRGYRIVMDASGRTWEYRTDQYGLVRPADGQQTTATPQSPGMPLATATPLASATPYPTATLRASATPYPTATLRPSATPYPTATPLIITDWLVEYFDNRELAGDPVLVRNDYAVNHDWGSGSPGAPLPSDGFSARWRQSLSFEEGSYRFVLRSDDGARLWVGGQLLIDRWWDGDNTAVREHVLWDGIYEVTLEYYENGGRAAVSLEWYLISDVPTATPRAPGDLWYAEFFDNSSLAGAPRAVSQEVSLQFDWGKGAPAPGVGADGFAARFQRTIDFDPALYEMSATVDDGVRVYVDDVLRFDGWETGVLREYIWQQSLRGVHTVRVEYWENTGSAALWFRMTPIDVYGAN